MLKIDYHFGPSEDVCRFSRWEYPYRESNPPLHTHTFHEIFWVEQGEGRHLINGKWRPLPPGMLIMIRPEDIHGFSSITDNDPVCFCNFAFKSELWHKLKSEHYARREAWFDIEEIEPREFQLSVAQIERLRLMAYDLESGSCDTLTSEAFLISVISLLSNSLHPRQNMPDWMEFACRHIAERSHFLGGTAEFARLAGRSAEHVAREVKRVLKKTPTDIVNEARMNYASQQLSTTMLSIVDIAAECGIENLGHFYKIFRRRFGVSPSRYRKHAYIAKHLYTADPANGRRNRS